MPKLNEMIQAPNFELTDTQGRLIRLVDYTAKGAVVLVLLRAFA